MSFSPNSQDSYRKIGRLMMTVQLYFCILLTLLSVQCVQCAGEDNNNHNVGLSKRSRFTTAPTKKPAQGVTCYNCNTTIADVSQCNTTTCANGQMCLLRTVNTGSSSRSYTMTCGPTIVCSFVGKRFVLGSDISIMCCGQDLCNAPHKTTTTMVTKKSTTFNRQTTTTTKSTLLTNTPTKHAITSYNAFTKNHHWGSHNIITPEPTTCAKDLIFIIEDSVGMLPWFSTILGGILSWISQLNIGHDQTRVAFGTFNVVGTTRWELDRYLDKASLQNAVRSLTPYGYAVNITSNLIAVEYVLKHFKKGNRDHVADVVVFVTGGHYHNDMAVYAQSGHTINETISLLHQKYHNVIAIAAGSADTTDVRHIATDSNHYFYINQSLDWASQHVDSKVMNLICH